MWTRAITSGTTATDSDPHDPQPGQCQQLRVAGDQREIVEQGLRREQPIERIAMIPLQLASQECMPRRDRKVGRPDGRYVRCPGLYQHRGRLEFAEAGFGGDFHGRSR